MDSNQKKDEDIFIKNANELMIDTEDNSEIQLKYIYSELRENQVAVMIFFNRWGWILCRLSAIELSKIFSKLEKQYTVHIKIYGFGPDDESLDDFKKKKIFNYPIYLPKIGKKFYKKFSFDNVGLLECYGFCNKNVKRRYAETKKYNPGYTFKGDMSQLGGCFIVNNKGKIIYSRYDKYFGDTVSEEELLDKLDEIFGKYINKNDNRDSENLHTSSVHPINKNIKFITSINNTKLG